jgi:type I restriction enzyme, S subunit
VRCGTDLLPEFLDAWTGSPIARRYFMVAGKQTTNLASINKTALGRLPVVIPLSSEQHFIIDALQLHEERSAQEASGLVKLRYLKQGLMDDLLTGRARVSVESEVAAA